MSRETAEVFRLRWCPKDLYLKGANWGFGEEVRKLLIPAGLVIPVHNDGKIVALVVRRSEASNGPKYWQVKGGGLECLALGEAGKHLLLVESHLDAYLIFQEASDLVSVISMNGTGKPFDPFSQSLVRSAPQFLVATDFDDPKEDEVGAGQGAFLRLKKEYPLAEYCPVPKGKDPGEMVQRGVSVRYWLSFFLREASGRALKLPPGYPGKVAQVQKDLKRYPHMVPCPKAVWNWAWKSREYCVSCKGHIHCINDWVPSQ